LLRAGIAQLRAGIAQLRAGIAQFRAGIAQLRATSFKCVILRKVDHNHHFLGQKE
jgi:X-X-X-Leu-X-X-Gly heptad repeat protein